MVKSELLQIKCGGNFRRTFKHFYSFKRKQWAKRTEQIDRVMQATVGMYGDLQGIAGKTLQEIEGLDLLALESPTNEK